MASRGRARHLQQLQPPGQEHPGYKKELDQIIARHFENITSQMIYEYVLTHKTIPELPADPAVKLFFHCHF